MGDALLTGEDTKELSEVKKMFPLNKDMSYTVIYISKLI